MQWTDDEVYLHCLCQWFVVIICHLNALRIIFSYAFITFTLVYHDLLCSSW